MEGWKRLACAVVLQAIEDYLMPEHGRSREEVEAFLRSDWFSALCGIDPETLIRRMKEVDPNLGFERCEALFESGECG